MRLLPEKGCLSKKRYPNQKVADFELKIINFRIGDNSPKKKLTRSYFCKYCGGYHLTSQQ